MKICDIGHEEVCYETKKCPACKALMMLQKKIDDLQEEKGVKKNAKSVL